MKIDWNPLDTEFALWRQAGLVLPVWWRDDDAITDTPALQRLAALSARYDFPVHIAIIPANAQTALADAIKNNARFVAVVHGWAHENHAPPGDKKSEFGSDRPVELRLKDAGRAMAALAHVLGRPPVPVFVPPWNRIAPDMFTGLADLGYAALSTFTPRVSEYAAPGLRFINTHLDPIDWRTTRSLADPNGLVAQIARQLADRRQGQADNDEPYGILTHHLVHNDAIWGFAEELIARFVAGPTRLWISDELTQQTEHTTK